MQMAPGTVLEGRYQIDRKLGEGGMGQVYLVTHTRLKKQFALKALLRMSDDPREQNQYLEQFETEAQLVARLEHPSLAQVSDFFEENGVHYLVMEYIDGKTLSKVVELAPRPLSQRRVLQWGLELLDVLEYLHNVDPPVIVRDLKPDNIMLANNGGGLKLIDFGIAKQLQAGKQTREIVKGMGTAEYAPLEQYGQGSTDQRSDLYALGATLYFLLTDSPPPPAWRRASEGTPIPDPRTLNPTVTDGMWEALQAMMALSREDRPANAEAVRRMLKAEVGKKPQTGGRPKVSQTAPKLHPHPRPSSNSLHLAVKVLKAEQLRRYTSPIYSLAFSPTHGILAVGSSFVHLWDLNRGRIWQKLWRGTGTYPCSVAFSTDGRWLAVGSHDAHIRIFEVKSGKQVQTIQLRKNAFFSDRVREVCYAYGSRFLGATSDLSNLRLWDSTTGKESYNRPWHQSGFLATFQQKSLTLDFCNKNLLAVGDSTGTLSLYEASSGKLSERLEAHRRPIQKVRFSPDGAFLVTAGADGKAILWETAQFKKLQVFDHPGAVESASFSYDCRLLATGCSDCIVRIWDVRKGRELTRLKEHRGSVYAVAFSAVSGLLATGGNDRALRIWELSW